MIPRDVVLLALSTALCACSGGGGDADAGPDLAAPDAGGGDAGHDAGPPPPPVMGIWTTASLAPAISEQAALLPVASVPVTVAADPIAAATAAPPGLPRIAVVEDLGCPDCLRVDVTGGIGIVHAGSLLGAQYGLARLLEEMGFRFFHPWRQHAPPSLALPAEGFTASEGPPAITLRGIQAHTLHPIEAYYATWEPSDESFDAARHEIDWLVSNRGNFFQWVALASPLVGGGADLAAWRAHTQRIVDYAHLRGIRTGIGIQLYGGSNLQRAFDLLDSATDPDPPATMRARLALIAGLGFDHVTISFGEFFAADPMKFITDLDTASAAIAEVLPGATQSGVIHVGNQPSLQVTYMGTTMLYYFLVQFADPRVVPWVHTVMYYDLFEDAGGAYGHDDFAAHRQFVLDRLHAHQPVAYFPETAYWVDFDDSVPTYLPVYARSRWLDLTQIDAQSTAAGGDPLSQHVIFTSGWEWGYWQNDVASLRDSYAPPARWEQPYEEMFAPWGAPGAALAAGIARVGEAQHHALIEQRLAPWLAGRDAILDAGALSGLVSQPVRPDFATIAAMSAADRATFQTSVVAPLHALLDATTSVQADLAAAGLPADPFFDETRDGIEVDRARTAFITALLEETLAHAAGSDPSAARTAADAALADAMTVVARRHAALLDPNGARLFGSRSNRTIYPHGYLRYANDVCFWRREHAQVAHLVDGATVSIPGCFP